MNDKRLKEKNDEYSYHLSMFSSEETLLNRIDKAIENIQQWESICGIFQHYENECLKDDLLNILRGEDK